MIYYVAIQGDNIWEPPSKEYLGRLKFACKINDIIIKVDDISGYPSYFLGLHIPSCKLVEVPYSICEERHNV